MRGVRCVVDDLSRSLPPTCLFRCLHPSRIVWPACVPRCVARIHARMHARVRARACARGLLAHAWARAVSRPSAPTSHTRPSAPSPPARPPAALPACLSRAGRRVLSPRRLIDFRLGKGWPRLEKVWPRISRHLSRVFARDGGAVGRCPLHARACQVWGLGCRHRRRQPVRDRSRSQGCTGVRFFFRFRGHPASSGPSE